MCDAVVNFMAIRADLENFGYEYVSTKHSIGITQLQNFCSTLRKAGVPMAVKRKDYQAELREFREWKRKHKQ